MKKEYITPQMQIVTVAVGQHLLAGSLSGDYVMSDNADGSENLSRGGYWDDED